MRRSISRRARGTSRRPEIISRVSLRGDIFNSILSAPGIRIPWNVCRVYPSAIRRRISLERAAAPEGESPGSSRDAMTSAEVGSKASSGGILSPAARDCRRENYRRDTLTRRETVKRRRRRRREGGGEGEGKGRKEGRKRRKSGRSERASEHAPRDAAVPHADTP